RWCTARERLNSSSKLLEIDWRHAGNEAALERLWPSPPWHDAIDRAGQKARAVDEGRPAGGVEATENVGPRTMAAHGRAQAARAIRQAADRFDHNTAAFGSFRRRCC